MSITTTHKCEGCDGTTRPVKGQTLERAIAIHRESCPGYLRRTKQPRQTVQHVYETSIKTAIDKGRVPAKRRRR